MSTKTSEYGVFPECDAQQPTEDADAVSAGGWYQGGDRTCGPNATTFRFIRDDNGIVAFVEGSRDVAMKRAARIVECVNACTGIADPAAFIRLAKQAGAAGHLDRKRFERAPCYLCGYNGEGYYQPDKHPCAALYHAPPTAAQQQGQESGGEVIQRHVVTKYRDGSVHVADVAAAECPHDWGQDEAHEDWARCYKCGTSRRKPIAQQPSSTPVEVDAPGSRSWMAEVCRVAALSLAAHGVRNDQLLKVADWIAQQSAAEPRSTHRVWRRNDWLSCYFEALSDHHIGCEQQLTAVDNEENQRTWQALWLVLNQTGTVVVPGSDIVSADWSRCQIEQTVHESTGAVRFRAILLADQPQEPKP